MQSNEEPQANPTAGNLPAPYVPAPPSPAAAAYPPYPPRRATGADPRMVIASALILLGALLFAAWYFILRPDGREQTAGQRNGATVASTSVADKPLPPPPTRPARMTPEETTARWGEIRDEYRAYLKDRVQLSRLLMLTEDSMLPAHRKPAFTFDLNEPPLPPGMDSKEVLESSAYRSMREDLAVRQGLAVYLERLGQRTARLVLLGDSLGPGEASAAFRRLHELGRAERQAVQAWVREGTDVAHQSLSAAQDTLMRSLPEIDRMVKGALEKDKPAAPVASGAPPAIKP